MLLLLILTYPYRHYRCAAACERHLDTGFAFPRRGALGDVPIVGVVAIARLHSRDPGCRAVLRNPRRASGSGVFLRGFRLRRGELNKGSVPESF